MEHLSEHLSSAYWNERYLYNQTTWDVGSISTPLKEYLQQESNKNISILIPGCGNAHEAEWLMQNNFNNVTLIDIAEDAVKTLKEKFKTEEHQGRIKIYHQDFFRFTETFELIIEQTFFCALSRDLRWKYVEHMNALLKENGRLVGVLFATEFDKEGPPYGGSKEEYEALFKNNFTKYKIEPCYNSIPKRAGNELFVIAIK